MTDEQREQRIKELGEQLCLCSIRDYEPIWLEYVALITGRSAEQVRKMELEKGLR